MTPEHGALLARVTQENALRLSFPRGVTHPMAYVSLSDLDTLLTLAIRGAEADGLVDALEWISTMRDEYWSSNAANMAKKTKATKALAAFTAATQSTSPGETLADQLSRIEDIVAPPLPLSRKLSNPLKRPSAGEEARGAILLVADGHLSVTNGPDLCYKLSRDARNKIMELMRENVRSVSDLHSIILASLSEAI